MLIIKSKGRRIEYVLKEYRKKVENTKVLKKLKSGMEYEKPSAKRRRIKQAAKRRNKHGK